MFGTKNKNTRRRQLLLSAMRHWFVKLFWNLFETIPGMLFPHKNRDKMCNASLTITAGTSYVYVESKSSSSPALEKGQQKWQQAMKAYLPTGKVSFYCHGKSSLEEKTLKSFPFDVLIRAEAFVTAKGRQHCPKVTVQL